MLDLTAFEGEYYEVRLIDGKELKLKRPTQGMYVVVMQMQELAGDVAKSLPAIMQLFARVLNRNTANLIFTLDELEESYDVTIAIYLIKDYFTYWSQEVKDKVNFQAAQ